MTARNVTPIAKEKNPRIGCAGWSIATAQRADFPAEGTHLERYAKVFRATEINSSFYRPHLPITYRRWAASVPNEFRFSVKLPRTITHEKRLRATADLLGPFLDAVRELGPKLGPLLVQLPPSLVFETAVAKAFFTLLRRHFDGPVCVEPRHATWFTPSVGDALGEWRIARVAADPALVPEASQTAGDTSLCYVRLHGSPKMYYSAYDDTYLRDTARRLEAIADEGAHAWCIFDNTAHGAAIPNALATQAELWHRHAPARVAHA